MSVAGGFSRRRFAFDTAARRADESALEYSNTFTSIVRPPGGELVGAHQGLKPLATIERPSGEEAARSWRAVGAGGVDKQPSRGERPTHRLAPKTPQVDGTIDRDCSPLSSLMPLDAIIIGAGPIGIATAVALKREGEAFAHVEAGHIGATIGWWAPGTRFFSSPERIAIAGVPLITPTQDKATREEYLAYLRGVVEQFDLTIHTRTRTTRIEPIAHASIHTGFEAQAVAPTVEATVGGTRASSTAGGLRASPAPGGAGVSPVPARFRIIAESTSGQRTFESRNVVVAIGGMHRPRLLNIPGEDLPHVSHYFRDPHEYFRRRVLIIGGRNSAIEAAIRLVRIGAGVALSYRGESFDKERIKYWLWPEFSSWVKSGRIALHVATMPERITPSHVTLRDAAGARRDVEADDVLALIGYEMDTSLLEGAGVEVRGEARAPRFNPDTMQTNIDGLFVAGTATAGTQRRFRVFIENCHDHAERIAATIVGKPPPRMNSTSIELPES